MNLDPSQLSAVHHALSADLALLQGPPGTGKTYIGVQLVKLLLHFRAYWQGDKGPILLVCYTNHALQQFLEAVRHFTNKIVKIGGKKGSAELEKYNLFDKLRAIYKGPAFN